eukprot:scaffold12404_cov132-Skeletonema_menzelii.AAC.2
MASRQLVGAGWGCSIYVTLTVLLSFQLQHSNEMASGDSRSRAGFCKKGIGYFARGLRFMRI